MRRREDDRLDVVFAARPDTGAFVVLVGASKSGKSRTAYEALLRHGSTRRLLDRFTDLAADLEIEPGGAVLWFDNLQDVLTEQHLLAVADIDRVLRRLVEKHRLVVMATILGQPVCGVLPRSCN